MAFNLIGLKSEAQDFCQSYLQNNRQMIIYSDVESLSVVLLIIDTNYWTLKVSNTELAFESEDRLPLNSSPLLHNNYSLAIKPDLSLDRKVAFFDVLIS